MKIILFFTNFCFICYNVYVKDDYMIEKIRKFMYKRNGIDDLFYFMFILYFIIYIVNLFLKSLIIDIIGIIIFIIMFYRYLSKDISKRKKENDKYLKLKNKIINYSKSNSIYKKCRKCKTVLKLPLPYKRGINHAKCPTCGCMVTIFTLKRQKIEVIRKK